MARRGARRGRGPIACGGGCRRGCRAGRGGALGGRRSRMSSPMARGARVLAVVGMIAGGGLLLAAQAPAPTPAVQSNTRAVAPLPPAMEILSRYTRAIGGEGAIRKYRSRRALGRFELRAQGISGPIEILAAAPNRVLIRITLGGLG